MKSNSILRTVTCAALLLTVASPLRAAERDHDFELGLFGGAAMFDRHHPFIDDDAATPSRFRKANPEFGIRGAYLFTRYLGVEAELPYVPSLTRDGSADVFMPRAHVLAQLPTRLAPFLVAGAGVVNVGSGNRVLGDSTTAAFHWGAGVKYRVVDRVDLRIDGRHILTDARDRTPSINAKHFEGLIGVAMHFGGPKKAPTPPPPPPKPVDGDNDGTPDASDACPDVAGVAEHNGCPPPDSDGDGIIDTEDACPLSAGTQADGCPVPEDPDGDGVPGDQDACPNEAGSLPNGCPDPDPDSDGVAAAEDQCPTEPETMNGFKDDDGCPDELPEVVKEFTGTIEGIKFKTGSAEVTKGSNAVLDKVVGVLGEFPDVRLLITGHTDDRGTEATNRFVSQQRAQAVISYLLSQGVAPERLEAKGVGPAHPVAPNNTREGRAKNRRIEFELL